MGDVGGWVTWGLHSCLAQSVWSGYVSSDWTHISRPLGLTDKPSVIQVGRRGGGLPGGGAQRPPCYSHGELCYQMCTCLTRLVLYLTRRCNDTVSSVGQRGPAGP